MSKIIKIIIATLLVILLGFKISGRKDTYDKQQPSATNTTSSYTTKAPHVDSNDFSTHHMKNYAVRERSPRKDIQILDDMILSYLTLMKTSDSLPLGENREVTKALLGENLYKTKVLSKNSRWINASGELIDRWGTPIFFHVIDPKNIGIRSAGPDKIMWNSDDIINNENAKEAKTD